MTAEVGLVLHHGGHAGTVVDLTEAAAVVEVGSARLRVPFGTEVRVEGTTRRLVSPAEADGSSDPAEKYVQALREWRSTAAKSASVPAYVVLNDAELVGIATSRPRHAGRAGPVQGRGARPAGALG